MNKHLHFYLEHQAVSSLGHNSNLLKLLQIFGKGHKCAINAIIRGVP